MYTYNVYKLLFYYFATIENYNTIFLFLKLTWCLSYYTRMTQKKMKKKTRMENKKKQPCKKSLKCFPQHFSYMYISAMSWSKQVATVSILVK